MGAGYSRKAAKTQRGEEAKKEGGREVSLSLSFFLCFFSSSLCVLAALREIFYVR
jgi:hypothetical protein